MQTRNIVFIALSILMAGCTVGPDYQMPDASLPAGWFTPTKTAPVIDDKAQIEQEWWHHFNDPVLDTLIEKASAGNFDVKIAEARLLEARAARGTAASDLLPTVNIKGSALRQADQIAFPETIPGIKKPFNTFEAGFDASWEPDVFGGKQRELESATAEEEAAQATLASVRVSMLAEIARNYVEIREYQAQIKITSTTIKAQQNSVSIARERYQNGKTSELDLAQSKAQLEQFKTQIPYYENLEAQSEYALDVLLGEQPGAAHALVAEEKPIPVSDKEVVLAAPATVIANRPDIRASERELASATAQQGVAVAKFFPDISLSGFVGFLNTDAGHVLEYGSRSWNVGGNILSPILNYGQLSANLDAADARQQEALATYQKSVISALSDVAKSVTAYSKEEEFRAAQARAVAQNRDALSIAGMRYKQGLTTFLDVLEAQRALYASQSQAVQADAQASENLIAVYKSLGGGWKISEK